MPNVKLYVEGGVAARRQAALTDMMAPLRTLLCARLRVPPEACQIALIAVGALPDQPLVNVELHVMPAPARTHEAMRDLAAELQHLVAKAADTHAAVRIAFLDPGSYIALK